MSDADPRCRNGWLVIVGFGVYLTLGTVLIVNTPPSHPPVPSIADPYRRSDIGRTAVKWCAAHGRVIATGDRCPMPGCPCRVFEGEETENIRQRQASLRHDQ